MRYPYKYLMLHVCVLTFAHLFIEIAFNVNLKMGVTKVYLILNIRYAHAGLSLDKVNGREPHFQKLKYVLYCIYVS